MNEKRLAVAFKNFVEKVFLPLIKRTDPQSLEWHRFSRLLNQDPVSVDDISQYVDSINNPPASLPNFPGSLDKKELPFMRKKVAEDLGPSHS